MNGSFPNTANSIYGKGFSRSMGLCDEYGFFGGVQAENHARIMR
jgi:hypothetical protein